MPFRPQFITRRPKAARAPLHPPFGTKPRNTPRLRKTFSAESIVQFKFTGLAWYSAGPVAEFSGGGIFGNDTIRLDLPSLKGVIENVRGNRSSMTARLPAYEAALAALEIALKIGRDAYVELYPIDKK